VHSPFRILFVGASITVGVGATSPSDAYPAVLSQEIGADVGPVAPTVVAHLGATVSTALTWPYPTDQDLILVHTATNDFLRSTPLPVYRASLLELLERLRSESLYATIVCLGVWAGNDDVNSAGVGVPAYDAVIAANCGLVGGIFVPLTALFERGPLHEPSTYATLAGPRLGFHPDDAGHERIAMAVYAALGDQHVLEPQRHQHVA
jgi:lysophospholipase L1-like esterase